MQKFVLTFFSVLLLGLAANAQFGICTPDETLGGDTLLVPLPYDPIDRPDGGISDSACLNTQFQFNFQFAIPDSFSYNGNNLDVDSFRLTGLGDLPEGMSFSCTPDCTFEDQTVGCVALFGVPTNPAEIGTIQLLITGQGFFNGSTFPLTLSFPDASIPEFTGSYDLTILEQDDSRCTIFSGSWDPLPELNSLTAVPNPATGSTQLVLNSEVSGEFELTVRNIIGAQIAHRSIRLTPGENRIDLDLSDYSSGLYLYSIRRGGSVATGRLIVE